MESEDFEQHNRPTEDLLPFGVGWTALLAQTPSELHFWTVAVF